MTETVLIMAGGTGGHVFPALSVAERLRQHGYRIVWLGTKQGIEARIVPAAGIEIEWLPVSGLRGKGMLALVAAPFRLARAGLSALSVFRRVRPSVVLGMGGFASGPGGVVGWLLRRPLVIHEQNAIAGMTNRILSRFATRCLVAFPGTFKRSGTESVVGNPVRESVIALPAPSERFKQRTGPLRILVLGGSLGARALNEMVPKAIAAAGIDVEVLHQCGRGDATVIREIYATNGTSAKVEPFIEDVASAYAWADLAICRAGAMTVHELAAAGLAAILVPFPYAVDDHQTANARYLGNAGAAVIIQESDMTPQRLAALLCELANRERLFSMSVKARRLAHPDATGKVAEVCMEVAGGAG